MSDLGPLPDDVRDFLDAERDLEHPEPATRDRMFARLVPFILPTGGADGGGAGPAAAGSAATSAVKAAWRGKVMLSLISAAIGAAGGATTHAVLTSPRSEPATIAPREISSSPLLPAPPATSEPAAPEPAPAATVVGSTPVSSARADQRVKSGGLLAERLLIESATEALTRGDSSSAIAALQRHAREFPKGQLVQEREALMVQALRASGDETSAQERAKDFKRKFPGSLQQGTVDKVSNPR